MKRLSILLVLAGCGASARTHVERAVEAHGGADALRAVTNYHIASEGAFMGMTYTNVVHGRLPYDWRYDMESAGFGKMTTWALGADGRTYRAQAGQTTEAEGDERNGVIGQARGTTAALLPDRLLADDVTLLLADPEEIDGRMHKGVEVRFGHGIEPFTLLFDPDTKRIARTRFRFFDPESLTWASEHLDFADYRQVDGVWVAHKTTMTWRGTSFSEDVTEVRFNRELDEALFATPETVAPPEVKVVEEPAASVAVHKFVGPPDQIPAAIARIMAWIGANGGQPAGAVTMIYRKPMNYADMSKNEVVIQVPVQMEKAPKGGDIWLGRTKAFRFARVAFTGSPMMANFQWGVVHEWCKQNGLVRSGPRRMKTLGMNAETGALTAEVGFPVKTAPTAIPE